MPRLRPSFIWKAHTISSNLAKLLPACRDIPSALNELRWIKEHVVSTRSSIPEARRLSLLCQRRGRGEPLQYVLGSQPFGALDIKCQPGVLIPRSETEASTLYLSDIITKSVIAGDASIKTRHFHVLDLCTGTGCIALLLFARLSRGLAHLHVRGVDISPQAVSLAQTNARRNKLGRRPGMTSTDSDAQRLDFVQGDIYSKMWTAQPDHDQKWDVLVSNPPYISHDGFARDTARSVRNFEPKLAQVPSPRVDVLKRIGCEPEDVFYGRLAEIAAVQQPRIMLFEVGDLQQAARVVRLFLRQPWLALASYRIAIWRDWPEAMPDADEATSLEIDGARVSIEGSGYGRSVFIHKL